MRNQPHSHWQVLDAAAERREEAWSLDRQVELRTWLLGVLALAILVGILARLSYLIIERRDQFLANAHPVTIRQEAIPAVDGRIYSSDGQLLAYDDEHFDIALHYRWLQDPPDPLWLRQQIRHLPQLTGTPDLPKEQAEELVLQTRGELWQKLVAAGKISAEEFEIRRAEIQQDVERIARVVNEARLKRLKEGTDPASKLNGGQIRSLSDLWTLLKQELTEPPSRGDNDPIIVREEVDYHPILEHVATDVVAEIESHPASYPGVRISPSTTRIYPGGPLASHVIGLRSSLREDQIRERQLELNGQDPLAYQAGDRRGRFGVERSYDTSLHGIPGEIKLTLDRSGEILSSETVRKSRSGKHLVLSLHARLQELAERLLDEKVSPQVSLVPPLPAGQPDGSPSAPQGGAILVMNVYSGEVLVAASAPRPDLTLLSEGSARYWADIQTDKRAPLLSRFTQVALAPGSVFKPATAVAICETPGTLRNDFVCQGFLEDPFSHRCAIFQLTGEGHGAIDLPQAISRSCNVFFFDAARRLGPEALTSWTGKLGFGSPTGIDLPFEQSGQIPTPQDNARSGSRKWYPGDLLGTAIGQSYLTVTPLQICCLMAALANGGEILTPQIVTRMTVSDRDVLASDALPALPSRKLNLAPETLQLIRRGLEGTVSDPQGTGYQTIRHPDVSIAGKTGTAQTGGEQLPHAWFSGYVPAEEPRYALVVMLEHAGSGGEQTGPLVRKLVQGLIDQGLIQTR